MCKLIAESGLEKSKINITFEMLCIKFHSTSLHEGHSQSLPQDHMVGNIQIEVNHFRVCHKHSIHF